MNLLYLFLASVAVFLATTIGFEKKSIWGTIIGALGVGGVVNANFFHAGDYPIDVFGWSFGVDSIIYTLFIFTVILKLFYYGKKEAYVYTISAAGAVLFAAIIELTACAFSDGHSVDIWRRFGGFVISVGATIAAGLIMIEVICAIQKKKQIHRMWLVIIGIVIATIINSTIYYGLHPVVSGIKFDPHLMYTSYFGKIMALGCACLAFFMIMLIEKKMKKIEEKKKKLEENKEKEESK